MPWRFEDEDDAIDAWVERDQPSLELRTQAYSRLLQLTESPVQPWAGDTESYVPGVGTGLFIADLVDDPLVLASYMVDRRNRVIYLGEIFTVS